MIGTIINCAKQQIHLLLLSKSNCPVIPECYKRRIYCKKNTVFNQNYNNFIFQTAINGHKHQSNNLISKIFGKTNFHWVRFCDLCKASIQDMCPVFPPILSSSLLQMGADIGGSLAMFVASASLATLAVLVAVLLLCLLKALATLIGTIILALPFLIAPLRNFCRMVLCSSLV